MRIWKHDVTVEALNHGMSNTLVRNLGIEITEIGDDYILSKMPVDKRTYQPMGLLHGGASAALSESIGSMASFLLMEDMSRQPVGLEINCNHLRSAREGWVHGRTTPIKIGRTIHVWNTDIVDQDDNLIACSRLTVMIKSSNKN